MLKCYDDKLQPLEIHGDVNKSKDDKRVLYAHADSHNIIVI